MKVISCVVKYHGQVFINCKKCTNTGLWLISLPSDACKPSIQNNKEQEATSTFAFSAYETSSQAELAWYHHQSLFSTSTSTVLKAMNHLESFTGLTTGLLKHLPSSTATPKDHMHQTRKSICFTGSQLQDIKGACLKLSDTIPPQQYCKINGLETVCFVALLDPRISTVYTDLDGPFSVRSSRNLKYAFDYYAYQPHAILVRPMKSRNDDQMVQAYSGVCDYLTAR